MRHPKQFISIGDSIALIVTKLNNNQYKHKQTLPLSDVSPHLQKRDYKNEIFIQIFV